MKQPAFLILPCHSVAPSHRFLTYQKQFFLSLVGKITGEGVEHTTVAEKFCGNAVFFGTQLTTQLNADGCPIFLGHPICNLFNYVSWIVTNENRLSFHTKCVLNLRNNVCLSEMTCWSISNDHTCQESSELHVRFDRIEDVSILSRV